MVWNRHLKRKWWLFHLAEQVSLIKLVFFSISFMFPPHCRLCTDYMFLSKYWMNCWNLIRFLMYLLVQQNELNIINTELSFAFCFHCSKVLQLESVACYLFSFDFFSLGLDWHFFLPDWKGLHRGILLKPEDMYIIVKHLST